MNRYGYVEKKYNGEKNIRKERVDNIEREIDVIKRAQEAYEKYLQVMSPEKAKKAASSAFNVDESKIGDVSDTRTIRRWIKEGKIRKTANIGAVRVSCGEVERFLKEVK